jgi:hypothetical protein
LRRLGRPDVLIRIGDYLTRMRELMRQNHLSEEAPNVYQSLFAEFGGSGDRLVAPRDMNVLRGGLKEGVLIFRESFGSLPPVQDDEHPEGMVGQLGLWADALGEDQSADAPFSEAVAECTYGIEGGR